MFNHQKKLFTTAPTPLISTPHVLIGDIKVAYPAYAMECV